MLPRGRPPRSPFTTDRRARIDRTAAGLYGSSLRSPPQCRPLTCSGCAERASAVRAHASMDAVSSAAGISFHRSRRMNTLLGPALGCIDFTIQPQRLQQVIASRDIRRALVSALDDQALHFDAIMALEAARPLVRAPRSQPSIDWARARLMELVCRGLTNKEIRSRVVHLSKHHEEARARRPPETRTRAPSTGVLSRV